MDFMFNSHFSQVFRRNPYKGHNISILYPNEEASFVPSEASTIFTIFPSYTPFLRNLLPPHILNFYSLPSHVLYFAVHPVCSTNGPLHNDSTPTGLLCQLPNWYVSCTIQLYLPSSSCCKRYST